MSFTAHSDSYFILNDCTNQPSGSCSAVSKQNGKRRGDHVNGSVRKRMKVINDGEIQCSRCADADEEMKDDYPELQTIPKSQMRTYAYSTLKALRSGDPFTRRLFSLPTVNFLESFVSSNKSDLYKCHSMDTGSFLTPPYACAFTHGSKMGKEHLLAVATEQGTVDVINTAKRNDWEQESQRITLQVHQNGVFDVKWSPSDAFLATASGDRTVQITDPRSSDGKALHRLSTGHVSTVKCIAWDPTHNDLLVSGGRDGRICLWDLREQHREDEKQELGTKATLTISYAHEAVPGKPSKKGRMLLAPKSVTSLSYLPYSSNEVLSSGSADGVLRKWDVRYTATASNSRSTKPRIISPIDEAVIDYTMSHTFTELGVSPRRPRGISSIALGCGPTAGNIFALGNDSHVHKYNAAGAGRMPLNIPQASQTYGHRHMATNSFYVRLSLSPCGQWLASGGANGSAFLFDVANKNIQRLQAIELQGQEGEVGAIDWADGQLATCADDGTVRVWRPDIDRLRDCQDRPGEAKFDWCWGRL